MTPTTFLFDLDMTLVDSSMLAPLRDWGHWDMVMSQLDKVVPFGGARPAHELPYELHQRGHKVGIVTSAPRRYAEALVARFEIYHDVLIAHGDTALAKPSPQPLVRAMQCLGCPADSAIYIGDQPVDVEAAYHAKIFSVGAGWGTPSVALSRTAPDVLLQSVPTAAFLTDLTGRGYVAEMLASGQASRWHGGAVLRCDSVGQPDDLALGRYFKSKDPRHASSDLSAAIIAGKQDGRVLARFSPVVAEILGRLNTPPRSLVTVPPQPGEEDRFAALRAQLRSTLPGCAVVDDGLAFTRSTEGYKRMGAAARAEQRRGAFSTSYDWEGHTVALIDDVHTTGATIGECRAVLEHAGAVWVLGLVLGKTQDAFVSQDCPACGREMRIRTRRSDGVKFWGCAGFPNECTRTVNL